MSTAPTETTTKKPWYKKWWIWAIVGAVLVISLISNMVGGGTESETTPAPVVTTEAPVVEEEPEEPVEEEPVEEPVADLADRTHTEYLNAWGVNDLIELAGAEGVTLPVWAIVEWEDMYAGTIRVYVQEDITRDVAEDIGHNILSLTGMQVEDLDVVVVRGIDGIDVNTYRRDVPLLNQ